MNKGKLRLPPAGAHEASKMYEMADGRDGETWSVTNMKSVILLVLVI